MMENFLKDLIEYGTYAKSVNDLVALLDTNIITRGKKGFSLFFDKHNAKHDFHEIYHLNQYELVSKRSGTVFKITDEEILKAHYLVCSLFFHYKIKSRFNEISLIGDDGSLETLSMDDYYTELSSFNKTQENSENALFIIEKEGNELKRKKRVRSEIYTNYIGTDIISESIVSNHEHGVIIGNPGVGKSTYARWLCNQWAKLKVKVHFILLYINLRELDFNNDHPILKYILQEYLPNEQGNGVSIEKILRTYSFDFKYILDGLDELEQVKKSKLERSLRRLTNSANLPPYLLLSRPYGLKDTIFLSVKSVTEILGFNEAQRLAYATQLLGHEQNMGYAFLQQVDKNPVLKDISFIPLTLSYLVLMFRADKQKENNPFESIGSAYELQDRILEILVDYHAKDKQMTDNHYFNTLGTCRAISGTMELQKEFVYRSSSSRDEFAAPALLLSELGIGRYEVLPGLRNWQFYFNSITFQEFLAAEYYGEKMTASAFFYLLGDLFYWNYAKMLLGYLNFHGKADTVKDILKMLEEKNNQRPFSYYFKLLYSILAELPPSFVQKYMDDRQIAVMIEMAHWASFDPLRGETYFDAVATIFKKLSRKQQAYFVSFIPYYLDFFIEIESKDDIKMRFPSAIVNIIKLLDLVNDKTILTCLLGWLKSYQEISKAVFDKADERSETEEGYDFDESEEQRLLTNYDFSLVDLYESLERAAPSSLNPFKSEIQFIYDNYRDAHEARTLLLLGKTFDNEHLNNLIEERYAYATATIELNKKNPDQNHLTDPGISVLAELVKRQAEGSADLSYEEKQPALENIDRLNDLVSYYAGLDISDEDIISTMVGVVVDAMVAINEPIYFDPILRALSDYDIPHIFEVRKPNAYFGYLQSSLDSLPNSGDNLYTDLLKLLTAFHTTNLGRLSVYRYRQQLFEIVQTIVNTHWHTLETLTLSKPYEETDREISLAQVLKNLFDKVEFTFHYPYDRKFLVQSYYDNGLLKNSFIAGQHIPNLLMEDYSISHDTWIWGYLHDQLLVQQQLTQQVLRILVNEDLYQLAQNAPYILRLWEALLDPNLAHSAKKILKKETALVFSGCYHFLRQFGLTNQQPVTAKFVALVTPWVSNQSIIKSFYTVENFNSLEFHPEAICFYILLSYQTGNASLKPTESFHTLLQPRGRTYRKVIYEILSIFNRNLAAIQPYLPDESFVALKRYFDTDEEINYELDKAKFLALLSN